MSGHRPFSELRAQVESKPGARERIEARKRAMRDVLRLAELRADAGVTQVELARSLNFTQSNVSRIEREEDVYLSTLDTYVAALGGTLEIRAVFPDRVVRLIPPSHADTSQKQPIEQAETAEVG
jgi:transcriptional regulator with XRE-family HTH domain